MQRTVLILFNYLLRLLKGLPLGKLLKSRPLLITIITISPVLVSRHDACVSVKYFLVNINLIQKSCSFNQWCGITYFPLSPSALYSQIYRTPLEIRCRFCVPSVTRNFHIKISSFVHYSLLSSCVCLSVGCSSREFNSGLGWKINFTETFIFLIRRNYFLILLLGIINEKIINDSIGPF